MLDGQTAEVDKPFEVNGYKIMFPGDTSAPGYLVYNCRCRIVAAFDDMPKGKRRAEDPVTGKSEIIPDMSYQEWAAKKRAENAEAWDTYLKKGRNRSADTRQWNEYKSVLGNKIPNTIDKFQNLKYTEPEKWERLKSEKRMTDFVENAPCATTLRKYTEFFLKPGAKHADQFFDVGYMEEEPVRLRYDMAKQFDKSKAVNISIDENGKERFRIYMYLGVDKKKRFRTVWINDGADGRPRIVTAFREED